jgi:hypothetical protein
MTGSASHRVRCAAILALLALGAAACSAQTDRASYAPGQQGISTFSNASDVTAFVDGCSAFVQERLVGNAFVSDGPERLCLVAAPATAVPPASSLDDLFTARQPGTWRLSYAVGLGCTPGRPLSAQSCQQLNTVVTNSFEVQADGRGLCERTGGRFDPQSCGDYVCGVRPLCQAVIPGCDCGPFATFVEGMGCVSDASCSVQCGGFAGFPCPQGSACLDRPDDDCSQTCGGADCPGFCVVTPRRAACGGFVGGTCSAGELCADDPRDDCDAMCGGADCPGMCVVPLRGDPRS